MSETLFHKVRVLLGVSVLAGLSYEMGHLDPDQTQVVSQLFGQGTLARLGQSDDSHLGSEH